MLTIYGRATSSNVQLVMWAVAELGLAHERLDYGHVHGGLDTPGYAAMNPHRRVPTLRDGDLVVWESCAILRYLAARYGDGAAFWPADPAARAPVDMWAEWGKTELAQAFTVPIFWARVRTAAKDRDEAALAEAVTRFNGYLARLGDQLSDRPYVCGDTFSAADIAIGHLLFRWFTIDVPRAVNPAVEAYYQRLTTRPAYRDHVMVDYAVLQDPEA
ncbi:glutathione S-transferase N-terminal domain-containing protein [Sedimentitalea sp. JM2-8]|uniref:Glutathione S-transferase N-terminal domain-containing protein n=1 Tax=Sedimentitalea xiamensis TaxID=3050037 RepID=A0ABT7FIG6_9RHOB|nr:glutathione S-transferase C-terminal domain-containing protein [Sedimentitalea xiamensis]MDK3074926.1 glutathione S-transferase N-terminal domain-containing protein [Sedimentitalea xiamensis]